MKKCMYLFCDDGDETLKKNTFPHPPRYVFSDAGIMDSGDIFFCTKGHSMVLTAYILSYRWQICKRIQREWIDPGFLMSSSTRWSKTIRARNMSWRKMTLRRQYPPIIVDGGSRMWMYKGQLLTNNSLVLAFGPFFIHTDSTVHTCVCLCFVFRGSYLHSSGVCMAETSILYFLWSVFCTPILLHIFHFTFCAWIN